MPGRPVLARRVARTRRATRSPSWARPRAGCPAILSWCLERGGADGGSSGSSLAFRVCLKRISAGLPRVPAGVAPSARVRSPMTALEVAPVARPLGVSEGAGEEEEAV